jgi:hypothetical protein
LEWAGGVVETVPVYGGGTAIWPVSGNAHAGAGWNGASGHVEGGSAFAGDVGSPELAATAGITYRWTAWMRQDWVTNSLQVRFYDAADVQLADNLLAQSGVNAWAEYVEEFTAPVGTAYMRLEVITAGLTRTLYDNVTVEALGTGTGDLPLDTVLQGNEAVGTATRAARCDHQHAHGLLSDSGTHYHDTDHIAGYSSGITDHGGLGGLGDDDHPQYQTAAEVTAQIESNRYRAILTDGFDTLVWEGGNLVWEWSS